MKELKSVYQALYEMTGREARLIGDVNNIKCAYFENIRFLDFQNYFECNSFEQTVKIWLTKEKDYSQII